MSFPKLLYVTHALAEGDWNLSSPRKSNVRYADCQSTLAMESKVWAPPLSVQPCDRRVLGDHADRYD